MHIAFTILIIAVAVLAAAVIAALLAMFVRANRIPGHAPGKSQMPECDDAVVRRAAATLSALIRFDTESHYQNDKNDYMEYNRLRDYLKRRFPQAHRVMTREMAGSFSMLYRWEAPKSKLKPILLCTHFDVAPAEGQWENPPFAGEVAGGFICGRGAISGKSAITAMFEALEALAHSGFKPERDIYISIGHDSTLGGNEGACGIARLLEQRGVRFEMVLAADCGIRRGVMGYKKHVALIGVAEKGCLTLRVSADSAGGESSVPKGKSTSGLVSEAVCRMEFGRRTARLGDVTVEYLKRMASILPFAWRLRISNLWFFSGQVRRILSRDPFHNALMRTTAASTILTSGISPYSLPQHSEAITTFHLTHHDTCAEIVSLMTSLTGKLGVEIQPLRMENASQISSFQSPGFRKLESSIKAVFGDIICAPWIMSGFSDARWFEKQADEVLRFNPIILGVADETRVCGADERIHIDTLGSAILFYSRFIVDAASMLQVVDGGAGRSKSTVLEGRRDKNEDMPADTARDSDMAAESAMADEELSAESDKYALAEPETPEITDESSAGISEESATLPEVAGDPEDEEDSKNDEAAAITELSGGGEAGADDAGPESAETESTGQDTEMSDDSTETHVNEPEETPESRPELSKYDL